MAANMDPNDFMATLINCIGLNNSYLSNSFEDWSPNAEGSFLKKLNKNQHFRKEPEYIARLHGEFLLLLIRIINARWVGMCNMTPENQLRRTLLHILAVDFQDLFEIKYL